ncbi:hypothetical protein [Acinetobacter dispersus]|uniref:hypothetical protein n=1 Tax=Acinetobacter dispersus TaxID=70348 RepID=UPI0005190179|nr:hypothetical protein [Acinetobacter dispersus]
MIRRVKEKIKKWYLGDPGDMVFDPVHEVFHGTRHPSKHWTASFCHFLINISIQIWLFFKSNWNGVITNILSSIAIFIAGYTLYHQINKDKEEYQRCTITSSNQDEIYLKCKK